MGITNLMLVLVLSHVDANKPIGGEFWVALHCKTNLASKVELTLNTC